MTNIINIGKVLSDKLKNIGISNIDELRSLGSRQAIITIATNNYDVCVNMLYALEGAIQGIRWHYLPIEEKQELNTFFKEFKKDFEVIY